jgi:hypothetical protein
MAKSPLVALLTLSIFVLAGCNSTVSAPSRPATVPLAAIWSGGKDGGAWYDCSFTAGESANLCAIYSERGVLWFRASYEIKGQHRAATKEEFREAGIDYIPHATEIHLSGNKTLIAVKILYQADAEHL